MKEKDQLLMTLTGTLSRVARAYKTAADKVARTIRTFTGHCMASRCHQPDGRSG